MKSQLKLKLFRLFRALSGVALLAGSVILPAAAQAPAKVADAKPGDFRMFVSYGVRVLFDAVKDQAEQALGHPFVVQYGPSNNLKRTIEAGQPFEAALMMADVLDELIADGKIVPDSRYVVAHVPVGVELRGDVPKVDVSTPEAIEKAMLNARSIKYAANGSPGPSLEKLFAKLPIRDAIKDKLNMSGEVQLGPGEYELTFALVSEIPSAVYLGQVPKEFNVPMVMALGIGPSGDVKMAKALIEFLQSPALEPALKAHGLTR